MFLPQLNIIGKSKNMVTQFLGYNHNEAVGDGEFYEMKNMTSSL